MVEPVGTRSPLRVSELALITPILKNGRCPGDPEDRNDSFKVSRFGNLSRGVQEGTRWSGSGGSSRP